MFRFPKSERPMQVGDLVKTWFDTGAMGAQILYGRVEKAGPKTYTVRWESDLTNRIRQGDAGLALIDAEADPELYADAKRCLARLDGRG